MYTLRIESCSREFFLAIRSALSLYSGIVSSNISTDMNTITVEISTYNIRELKRIIDILESEEFMKNEKC